MLRRFSCLLVVLIGASVRLAAAELHPALDCADDAAKIQRKVLHLVRVQSDSDVVILLRADFEAKPGLAGPCPGASSSAAIINGLASNNTDSVKKAAVDGATLTKFVQDYIGNPKGSEKVEIYGLLTACGTDGHKGFVLATSSCQTSAEGSSAPAVGSPNTPDYLINGEWLDPNRIYAVAFSATLAKHFAYSPKNGPPNLNRSEAVGSIAFVNGCKRVEGENCEESGLPILLRAIIPDASSTPISGKEIARRTKSDFTCPNTRPLGLLDAHSDWLPSHKPKPAPINDPAEEDSVEKEIGPQNCRLWRFSVENAALSFDATRPTLKDSVTANLFPGVANTTAIQQHSHDLAFSGDIVISSEGPNFTYGAEVGANVSEKTIGDSSVGQKLSFAENQAFGFFYFQIRDRKRSPKWNYVRIVPFDYEPAVLHPVYQFSSAATPSLLLNVETRKPVTYAFPKIGTRVDGRRTTKGEDNFGEIGWQLSHEENILADLTFVNHAGTPDASAFSCGLMASVTFQKCVAKGFGITPTTKALAGYSSTVHPSWYWNFKKTMTFKKSGVAVVVDGHGDWFWSRRVQYQTQTKIDSTLDMGIKTFERGGLSLTPTYTLFAYENQNQYDHIFVNQYSVKLIYNLDRRSRASFWDAVKYRPPASDTGSSGSSSAP